MNKLEAIFVVESASFLNRTVLATRNPMFDYSWFSFNKTPNPLDKWVLDKTYNYRKYNILKETESQGRVKSLLNFIESSHLKTKTVKKKKLTKSGWITKRSIEKSL